MSKPPRPPPVIQEVEDEDVDIEDKDEEMEEMMDPFEALGSFLSTDDGETIATTTCGTMMKAAMTSDPRMPRRLVTSTAANCSTAIDATWNKATQVA